MSRRRARLALIIALSLAGAACGSSGGDESATPAESTKDEWPADWARIEEQVLDLVNTARSRGARCGARSFASAPPLRMEAALRSAARGHSRDMADHDFLDHTGSDGSSPWDRAANAHYSGFPNAENVAAGQMTASAVVEAWLASSGHCANMMNPDSNEIGIGYAFSKTTKFRHYWTQSFGVR